MASINKPEIFLLSLAFQSFLDKSYESLIDGLHKSATLKRAKATGSAIRYLDTNNPKAIIVTDEGLTETENKAALDKVMLYLRNGGLVIFALHFPSFITMDVFDRFWKQTFDLPWKHGDYHRTDFQFNRTCTLPNSVASASFPAPYSMKVLHVKDARSHEKLFVPTPGSMTQSHVFPPGHVDLAQAGIVGTKVGNGYMVYVGDVNGEKGSDSAILALCGL
jgi:hypothetical protein